MTVKTLIELLTTLPFDAEVCAWNPDQEGYVPVTGLLTGPPTQRGSDHPGCRVSGPDRSHYSSGDDPQRDTWEQCVEICTDEP